MASAFLSKGAFVRRILVATDFSEYADRALSVAIDYAIQLGAAIDLVHVYTVPMPIASSVAGAPLPTPLLRPDELIGIQRQLDLLAERARTAGVDCLTAAVEGDPTVQILAEAQKLSADLIVMGTHGRTGVRRVIFGSVAENVLRKASSPVLVVPPAHASAGVGHPLAGHAV
jgi:nucleotide-binding universal stress UspA family protein